ncbi:hypothetical protein Tco_1195714 [Tanacetum coccineum]
MESGFLLSNSKTKNKNGDEKDKQSTQVDDEVVKNDLASRIKNIDGKFWGRKAVRGVQFVADASSSSETTNVHMSGSNSCEDTVLNQAEKSPDAYVQACEDPNGLSQVEDQGKDSGLSGKRLAFMLVEKYVKNTWAKFGLERVILRNGLFLFQFSTREGMERVLENGSWLIRLVPLILNIWSPNTILKKDEITSAPVWVKLHNVLIVAYSETGLSLITKKMGRPLMLDTYTSDMCLNPWGRNSYARALIEVSAANALLDSIVVIIPLPNGKGHTLETIEIEYEWKPTRGNARDHWKISQIKDRLKAARDRQKSYADKRRKPLEFSVGDYSIEKVSPVAYRLDLPEELNGVHDTFHVSNLKKCLADLTLQVPLDEIQVDAKLNFMEGLVEILEREVKKLKWSRIAIVKEGKILEDDGDEIKLRNEQLGQGAWMPNGLMVSLLREMEKMAASNNYDGLGESLLERMRRSRELRDASIKFGMGFFGATVELLVFLLVINFRVSLSREMEKMVAFNNYDGLGESLLERMQRSREFRDASINRSRNPSPEGLHSHDNFWGGAFAESTQPQPVQAKAGESIKKVVKNTELRNDERVDGAAVAIPFDAVEEVSARFTNTLYGYFIGKRLAFKLVEIYVKNTWAKYSLKRVQLHDDFFLFQFETKDGMDNVLENGPLLIRTVPLILNVWSPNTDLKKAEVKKAPVWVKLHHVPIVAYSEIGLSLITTQIGKPIMLDSYTSNMCLSSWGRSTYARALIKVSADNEIMESLTIAIPIGKDKGHMLATIDIEYEWKLPRCSNCMIFDHFTDKCPKLPKENIQTNTDDEGFVEVKKKKNKNKSRPQRQVDGIRLSKPPPKLYYRCVETGESSKAADTQKNSTKAQPTVSIPAITVKNAFDVLDREGKEDEQLHDQENKRDDVLNVSDSEVDEEILVDDGGRKTDVHKKGASTPVADAQAIHTRIWLKAERKEVFCSFIYAHNRYTQRRSLWRNLSMHKLYIRDRPCFETVLRRYRIMANMEFNDQFVGAYAIFRPYRVSDHSPSMLCLPTLYKVKPKPFKFFNVVARHERFMEVVKELLYEKGNLHANVIRLRTELDSIQTLLDADPFNASLREAEAACVVEFNQAAIMEERFLKQKAKINWLKEGDANSAYFHKTVKSCVSRSKIDVVTNAEGVVFANEVVPDVFVSHYEAFLGLAGETHGFNTTNLFKTYLNEQVATDMIRNVTTQEVKEALFSMGNDKSPGPDGYTACFFKTAWDVVVDDVPNATCEFFRNGNLLKELNHTTIALILKVKSPTSVNDYRPISCCNVLFKCISKIIANRIKHSLKLLISPNQSAFIPGRSITDNMLLTQELMHNYPLGRGTPRASSRGPAVALLVYSCYGGSYPYASTESSRITALYLSHVLLQIGAY